MITAQIINHNIIFHSIFIIVARASRAIDKSLVKGKMQIKLYNVIQNLIEFHGI